MTRTRTDRTVTTLATGALLALTVSLAGCAPPDISPAPGMDDPYPAPMNDPRITVHDEQLRHYLGFHTPIVRTDDAGLLHVEQPVRNLADQLYTADYRIMFFDSHDMLIDPVMGWQMLPMQPKEVARMRANSLSDEAVNYRIEVKWSR